MAICRRKEEIGQASAVLTSLALKQAHSDMLRALAALAGLALPLAPAAAIVGDAGPADAVIARYAVMFFSSRGACTGAVLAQDLVLTAAHCTVGAANFKFVGHSVAQLQLTDVANVAPHPQFNPEPPPARATADIALLKLFKPLPARFAPAFLAARPVAVGDRLIVVGYGTAVQGDVWSGGTARMATLTVAGRSDHELILTDPSAYGEGSKLGACHGDSGAPVFTTRGGVPALIGVVSRGGCGVMTSAVPLVRHRDWLMETARTLGSSLDP